MLVSTQVTANHVSVLHGDMYLASNLLQSRSAATATGHIPMLIFTLITANHVSVLHGDMYLASNPLQSRSAVTEKQTATYVGIHTGYCEPRECSTW